MRVTVEERSQQDHNDVIRSLLEQLEAHAAGERAHAHRVAVYAAATAFDLGIEGKELLTVRCAAELHDIGKLAIDRTLLAKGGALWEEDWLELRRHPLLAAEILAPYDWLSPSLTLIRHHHERWDESGYPDGRGAEHIPLGSRIIAVAEAFDVMNLPAYPKPAMSEEHALAELQRCAGSQFDLKVVLAFLRVQPLIQPIGEMSF